MLSREDMLELTRRMTPARTCFDRIAGSYRDEDGIEDGSFNIHFLKLMDKEKADNLKIAKAIPFSETKVQLKSYAFPGSSEKSKEMAKLLYAIKSCSLKNDALLETFYEVVGEKQPKGEEFAIVLFHGVYDIPRKGTDNAEQWESEEVYEYLICAICPVYGDYEMDEPVCGFLYPSFKDRSVDWYHIAVYEKEPGVSGRGLKEILI